MNRNEEVRVPKRILNSLLASLCAGVVPRMGAPYIAIGRKAEIAAFLSDLENISEGGASMRFLIGRYGSGKSFLMQLVRGYALERDFLTADADLSPERRLYGTAGTGVATYRELMKNLASKASPEGGALPKIIARWLSALQSDIGEDPTGTRLQGKVMEVLRDVEFMVGGFDFSRVVAAYHTAYLAGDDEKMSACLCWLRGEFATKTEAKSALGFPVSVIINDENWYDFIKLFAVLARKIGYRGLVVFIDECVNLYKITHRVSRENNYEKILSMFNDSLQGKAEGLLLVLGGTPQFLEDPRRGLFSYEALRSRLCDSRFASDEFQNLIGPVIRLRRLSDDEIYALLVRVTDLFSERYGVEPRITKEEQERFLTFSLRRAGADSLITPREILRDYLTVLNILLQNENARFDDVAAAVSAPEKETAESTVSPNAADPDDLIL
ncbi:MAG: ATP-binding protein [Eubacteriales bacterium]|nr:ATP-binding protein [Eubacteriales bacterium]MDY2826846.1 ATP-binding protein [Eubacteriales bacterium]